MKAKQVERINTVGWFVRVYFDSLFFFSFLNTNQCLVMFYKSKAAAGTFILSNNSKKLKFRLDAKNKQKTKSHSKLKIFLTELKRTDSVLLFYIRS